MARGPFLSEYKISRIKEMAKEGYDRRTIAERLGISYRSVANYDGRKKPRDGGSKK
ncbi:MAG: hypothetical protein JRJ31_16910 [Deltaproteobacteria bacterium]|nr:hypothetical protein [Deltaproteobacteria bacterium]